MRHFGQRDLAIYALRFRFGRTRERVILRRSFSFCDRAFDDCIDDDAVLGVHADQAAGVACHAHRFVNRRVVDEKDSRVGHEELETRHALPDQVLHLR